MKYKVGWTLMTVTVVGVQATAAAQGRPTAFLDNVVCMSLPLYIVSLLLPAREIAEFVSYYIPSHGVDPDGGD